MTPRQLARVARVRDVQFALARAAEADAHQQAASEAALNARVAQLAAAIAPAPSAGAGFSLTAAAQYRVDQADARAAAATDAARAAGRDVKAVEKLQDRADADAALAAMRALEGAPLPVRRLRHDPC